MKLIKGKFWKVFFSVILVTLLTAGFVSGSFYDVSDYDGDQVHRDFFLKDEELNARIVVGSDAAFEDVRSATDLEYEIRDQLVEKTDLHLGSEDVTTIHIPVFSNYYNRPGNIGRSDELIDDHDYEDLDDNDDWYVSSEDDEFKGFDWTENGILEGEFSGDDTNQLREEFSYEVPKEIRVFDESETEYFNIDLEIKFEIDNIKDLNDDGIPVKEIDLDIKRESVIIDFTEGANKEFGSIFGEGESRQEFDGVEIGDQIDIFNEQFNVAGIEDQSFYHGTKYDSTWARTGETLSFGNYSVRVMDIDTTNGEDQSFIEVETPEGEKESTIMSEGEYKDFGDNITINVKSIFSGIEGTNSVQISAIVGKVDVKEGSNWPGSGYVVKSVDTSGDRIDSIELNLLDSDVQGEEIDLRDYWDIDYAYKEMSEDVNNDGREEYAFESWLEFTKVPETSPETLDILTSDEEIKPTTDKNLILIGGPLANKLTDQMVENGVSDVDWYEAENGKIEYLRNFYGNNNVDVLIVSGSSRWSTKDAVHRLIRQLRS